MKKALVVTVLLIAASLIALAQTEGKKPAHKTPTIPVYKMEEGGVLVEPRLESPGAEQERINRLAGLAKIWGAVKYFHPYIAYKDIDWDAALIKTIPKVDSANTADEYRKAIDFLLSFLKDANTYAEIAAANNPARSSEPQAPNTSQNAKNISVDDFLRTENDVTVIDVMKLARFALTNNDKAQEIIFSLPKALTKTKAAVLDCRGQAFASEMETGYLSFIFDFALSEGILPNLIDRPITLGANRFRVQNGYTAQGGGVNGGGYYSSMVTTSPVSLTPRRPTGNPARLAIIIDNKTPANSDLWIGLQAAEAAVIIQEGSVETEPGVSDYKMTLPESVVVHMRTSELVSARGELGFHPDLIIEGKSEAGKLDAALAAAIKSIKSPYVKNSTGEKNPSAAFRSVSDDPYPQMEFPSKEYRLLALFRFWNVINYFYPYKHILNEPWENVLAEFVPKMEADKDVLDYEKTVHEMATTIHDSHATFVQNTKRFDEFIGSYFSPVVVRSVGGQTVITHLLGEKTTKAAGLNVGDVILSIDDKPVADRIALLNRYFSASTPQSAAHHAEFFMFAGGKESQARLRILSSDGQPRDVTVSRSMSTNEYDFGSFTAQKRQTPIFGLLPSGFGYIDLARLERADADKAMDQLMNAPAIIFDMRGYPNGTAWTIAPRLTERKNVIGALFQRPIVEARSLGENDYAAGTFFQFAQRIPESKDAAYKGKVVMLINEAAISQSEHTCLFFEAATKVTFIGTPTAGANGDVTSMVLPGNIIVSFTGHDVRHADGRQLQRTGIQPDIRVEPTVRGIREGRDEILEAAVKFLQGR